MLTNQTQYREVKRKAAVGERIKIVAAGMTFGRYSNGDEFTVNYVDRDSDVYVSIDGKDRLICFSEYAVLEPVESASSALSPTQEPDELGDSFRQFILANADAIRAILPEVEAQFGVTRNGSISAKNVTVAPVKPLTRAQVIAKATADVAELLRIGRDNDAVLPDGAIFVRRNFDVTFYVNRDKRAVTALIRKVNPYGKAFGHVVSKHTAKCSPADVFHAEIGKAIALRKALGLTVPSEYTDAPQPEKAYAGAKVYSATRWGTFTIADGTSIAAQEMSAICYAGLEYCDTHGAPRIIDDTDVDYGVNAVSAAEAKEAA